MFRLIIKHKKLFLAGFLPFLFWGAVIGLWFFRAPESAKSSSATIIVTKERNIAIGDLAAAQNVFDDDKDGLSNWEEAIYGTDPKNADSDGDGFLDGEEVLSGRNPAKKGPSDLLAKQAGPLSKEEEGQKTATDAFAKVALLNFINNSNTQSFTDLTPEEFDAELKKSFGNSQTTEEYQKAMRAALYNYIPQDFGKKIKISETSSEKEAQIYVENLQKIMAEASAKSGKYTGHLYEIIADAFQKKDFAQIDDATKSYMFIYDNMIKLTAPKSVANIHRHGLLLFYETSVAVKALKNWEEDPVGATIAVKKLAFWLEKNQAMDKQINQ